MELLEDYHAAWNDLDVDALGAVMTNGYVHLNATGQFDRDEQIRQLSNLDEFGWHPMEGSPPPLFESSGDAVVTGDGPWHVALLSDSTGSRTSGRLRASVCSPPWKTAEC